MIRIDNLTRMFTGLAVFIPFYFYTVRKEFIVIFPTILLITGIVLTQVFSRRGRGLEFDEELEEAELKQITVYTLSCLAVFGFASLISAHLFLPRLEELAVLTLLDYQLYGVLMAVAEEWFFRGALLSLLSTRHDSFFTPLIGSSIAFTAYHFSRYGLEPNSLIYVFMSGIALGFAVIKTRRLTPAILAHVINNYYASMMIVGGG